MKKIELFVVKPGTSEEEIFRKLVEHLKKQGVEVLKDGRKKNNNR